MSKLVSFIDFFLQRVEVMFSMYCHQEALAFDWRCNEFGRGMVYVLIWFLLIMFQVPRCFRHWTISQAEW